MTLFELLGVITIQQDGAIKSIDDVEKKADSSSTKMNASFTKVGRLLKGALLGGAAAAGSAIAAFGLTALKSAGDVEVGIDRMAAKLGITADEAKGLGEVAKSVFKDSFGGSLGEAVSMVETLRQKLGAMSDEETKRYTEMAATISDLYGADYAQTVGNAQTLMDNFGLSANQAFDFITTGYQKGLDASGDFSASIGEYATQFANGGATADQFFGVLESGMQNGVLGTDKAADAFKEFRLRIQDGSKLTSESLKQIGIDSDEMARQISSGQITAADAFQTVITKLGETEDPMIRMQAGAGLIGSQFEDLGDTAVQQLSLTTTSLDDMAGATDRAGQAAYDNLGGKLSTLWRTLRTEAITALEPLIPYLSQFTDILIDKAPLMIEAGQQVASYLQKWGPTIGTVVQEVSTVVSDSFTAMSLLWTNVLKPSWDAIEPFVSGLFQALGSTVKAFIDLLEGDFVGAADNAWDGFSVAFTGLSQTVVNIVKGIWRLVEQPLINLKNKVVAKATAVKDEFLAEFEQLKNDLWYKAVDLWAYIALPMVQFKQKVINEAIEVYNGFKDNFEDLNNKVVEIVSGLWVGIKSHLETFATNVVAQITSIPERIKDVGQNIVDNLISGITGKKSELESTTADTVGIIEQTAADTLDTHSPSKALYKIGQYVVQGLAGGISDPAETAKLNQAAVDIGNNLATAFYDSLGIGQAENDWVLAGRSIIQGFIDGMKSQWPQVETFLQRLRDARPDVTVPIPNASSSVTGSVGVPASGATAVVEQARAIIMPAVQVWTAALVSTANTATATGSYIYQSVLNHAALEFDARRIMLDTQIAQQNASMTWWQTLLQNVGMSLQSSVTWISTTLGNAVTWVGTSVTTAANWLGGMLTFSADAWGQTTAWVGGVFTGAADFAWQAITGIGSGLLELASSQIPWLGAMMDGLSGGPVAMLTNLLVSLFGETWQFQAIITRATEMVEPLIAILGDLITAIWPLIEVIMSYLKVAFDYLGSVIKNVVTPVFTFVARVIASVWNALATAINWALGWLGVHVNTVTVNAAPVQPYDGSWADDLRARGDAARRRSQRKRDRENREKGGDNDSPKYKPPSTPKYQAPKAPKTSAPSYKAPKAPSAPKLGAPGGSKAPSMGKTPGGSKTPGMSKTPGYKAPSKGSKTPGYSGGKSSGSYSGGSGSYDSSSNLSRGSGGTKVSEITGPTRDFLADAFASFAALPTLVGIQSKTYDLLSQKLGNVPVIAGAAFAGGPTITIENVNLSASGNLDYDVNQFVDEIEAKLFRRFTTGKRGTGR